METIRGAFTKHNKDDKTKQDEVTCAKSVHVRTAYGCHFLNEGSRMHRRDDNIKIITNKEVTEVYIGLNWIVIRPNDCLVHTLMNIRVT
jgi:hypothetical protein